MPNARLREHYEWRYAGDSQTSSIDCIPRTPYPRDRFEAAVLFLPRLLKGGDVLEIGAGTGHIAKTLLQSVPAISSYTLSDLSRPRVEGIRRSVDDARVSTVELDAEEMPASMEGRFDAIVLIALIEHLVDPIRAMRNIRRALKPGGFVYVDTPNIARYTQRLKLLAGRFPSTGSKNEGLTTFEGEVSDLYDEGHLHYFTFRSLSLVLKDFCGYSRVEKMPYPGGFMPLGRRAHNALARMWPEMFSELLVVAYK